jgi:hypothetical protein
MAVLPTQSVARTGLVASYAAVSAGGDKVSPGDHVALHVKNGNAAACTVTIVTPGTLDGLGIADLAVTVAAGAEEFIGPLPASLFRGSDGYADVTWSVSASVTAAVLTV